MIKLPDELAELDLSGQVLDYFGIGIDNLDQGNDLPRGPRETVPPGPAEGLSLWGHEPGRHLQNLYLFESVTELLCFAHLRPSLLLPGKSAAFCTCGLQWSAAALKSLLLAYPLAKFHLCFAGDLCGRVLDCMMALWSKDKLAEFHYSEGYVLVYFQDRRFKIHELSFSMSGFERLTRIRSGLCTHKPANGQLSWLSLKKSIDNPLI